MATITITQDDFKKLSNAVSLAQMTTLRVRALASAWHCHKLAKDMTGIMDSLALAKAVCENYDG